MGFDTKDDDIKFSDGGSKHQAIDTRKKWKILIGGIIIIGAAFAIGLVIGLFTERAAHAGAKQNNNNSNPTSAPKAGICSAKVKPLLLISLDGFRPDYFNRGFCPNLMQFATKGVRAEYMQSCFPTRTFPNHYTIATGLYPAYHGIVANYFYDPVLKDTFSIGGKTSTESKWWGGEPIWVTARKNNLKSASYFWVGSESEIGGYRPNYWYKYNGSIPYMERVKQFFKWIDMPEDQRPTMITMYFDQPDYAGHRYGPDSNEVNQQIKRVDDTVGAIFKGLKQRAAENCINIIITSDHGMRSTCCGRIVYLDKYIDVKKNYVVNYGPFGGIRVNNGSVTEIVEKLRCKNKHVRTYKKQELPIRLHYYNNIRIPDVVLLPNDNWLVRKYSSYTFCDGANHGWDNLDRDMRTIFLAGGPAFKNGIIREPFLNIEIYNLMATLLGVKSAINNGTMGTLNDILKAPPKDSMTQPSSGQLGKVCRVPMDPTVYNARANCGAECLCQNCNMTISQNLTIWNNALNMTIQEEKKSEHRNFPWGVPKYTNSMDTCTLYQKNYITGYSNEYKVPWFAGYFLSDSEALMAMEEVSCFRRDVRLDTANQTANCSNYKDSGYNRGNIAAKDNMRFDLEAQANSFLLSNVAPQFSSFNTGPWLQLERLSRDWVRLYGGIHIISGSILKAERKNVWSNPSYWLNGKIGSVVIPTHFYKIFAKCRDTDLLACNQSSITSSPCNGKIDVIAFILPHINSQNPQCQRPNTYLYDHVASIRDIEKLIGVNFFPNLSVQMQNKIESKVAMELWPTS